MMATCSLSRLFPNEESSELRRTLCFAQLALSPFDIGSEGQNGYGVFAGLLSEQKAPA